MITIFSTPSCPYCNQAKDFFTEHNIEFKEVDVASDAAGADEMVKKSGQMGVPVILVPKNGDEEVVVGFDQARLSDLLGVA